MFIFTDDFAAFLTIACGFLLAIVGGIICHRRKFDFAIAASFAATGFTVAPLAILLWNCLAIAYDAWRGTPSALISPTFNTNIVLVAFAATYAIIRIAGDLVDGVRNAKPRKKRNPSGPRIS